MTEAGVKKLATSLPRCRIEWQGGVIEPSDAHFREADRLLARGFTVGVKLADGKAVTAKSAAELPDEPFTLTDITRDRERNVRR